MRENSKTKTIRRRDRFRRRRGKFQIAVGNLGAYWAPSTAGDCRCISSDPGCSRNRARPGGCRIACISSVTGSQSVAGGNAELDTIVSSAPVHDHIRKCLAFIIPTIPVAPRIRRVLLMTNRRRLTQVRSLIKVISISGLCWPAVRNWSSVLQRRRRRYRCNRLKKEPRFREGREHD